MYSFIKAYFYLLRPVSINFYPTENTLVCFRNSSYSSVIKRGLSFQENDALFIKQVMNNDENIDRCLQ